MWAMKAGVGERVRGHNEALAAIPHWGELAWSTVVFVMGPGGTRRVDDLRSLCWGRKRYGRGTPGPCLQTKGMQWRLSPRGKWHYFGAGALLALLGYVESERN